MTTITFTILGVVIAFLLFYIWCLKYSLFMQRSFHDGLCERFEDYRKENPPREKKITFRISFYNNTELECEMIDEEEAKISLYKMQQAFENGDQTYSAKNLLVNLQYIKCVDFNYD